MDPFQVDEYICWNGLGDYYTSFMDFDASDLCWTSPTPRARGTPGMSLTSNVFTEKGMKRGREQKRSPQSESKACREKLRREKMNDKFSELCLFLHPERPAKADKSTVLGDAICALNNLQSELQELKEKKRKLQDDIQNLKSEKNKLKEEKLQLKARKENMELKMQFIAGFVPVQPAVYKGQGNKLMAFSGYGGFPMWQWSSPAVLDTSQDHVLRPPVA